MVDENPLPKYLLLVGLVTYIVLFFLDPYIFLSAVKYVWSIIKSIFPVFVLVFVLMVIINYFVNPKKLKNLIGKTASHWKKYFFAIIFGIISTGPIYLWYPMLRDLYNHGVGFDFIATFLYNRAVKPALLPLLIFYFGIKFTVVLTVVMIIFSVLEGFIFSFLERKIDLVK